MSEFNKIYFLFFMNDTHRIVIYYEDRLAKSVECFHAGDLQGIRIFVFRTDNKVFASVQDTGGDLTRKNMGYLGFHFAHQLLTAALTFSVIL